MNKEKTNPAPKEEPMTDFGFARVPENKKSEHVREVFDEVAPKYDLMNDLLSFGLHRVWKQKMIKAADPKQHERILDIAGGTGDISIGLAKKTEGYSEIWLTDINEKMLSIGRKRRLEAGFEGPCALCNAEELPFADNTFDLITVAFGLRNMTHKDKALKEMLRVCKPGGKVVVLEFSKPAKWLAPFYDFYSFKFMPWLGKMIAGSSEDYRYLAESIKMHPDQKTLAEIMRKAGFKKVEWFNYNFGITALHIGYKPQ